MPESNHVYHENLMGIYVVGTMCKNYITACIKDKSKTVGTERYTHNKMSEATKSIDKMLQPTVSFLRKVGALESMEDDILKYHDVVDEVFGMTEPELKRVEGMIARIKRDRKI